MIVSTAAIAALLAVPAGPGSRTPRLTSAPDALYLSWQERGALKLASWDGRAWSSPRVVVRDERLFVNWADFPSVIALEDGSLAAHWMLKTTTAAYHYDVWTAVSRDKGRTWSAPVRPHRDGTNSEHGFATLVPGRGAAFTAIWLDGRHNDGNPQALFAAEWDGARYAPETELDSRVCDCCATSADRAGEDLVVAYRDRGEDERRDMSIVRRVNGAWTKPAELHRDGWIIKGCPVNGPALAARGTLVAAAWYTMAADKPRVRWSYSRDGGRTFSAPAVLDEGGQPLGRVGLLLTQDGSALASWIENGEDGAQILARRVRAGGRRGKVAVVASVGASRSTGHPQIVLHRGRLIAAWTDAAGSSTTVKLASLDSALLSN